MSLPAHKLKHLISLGLEFWFQESLEKEPYTGYFDILRGDSSGHISHLLLQKQKQKQKQKNDACIDFCLSR
jgi:hypothetical protein